MMVYVVSAGYDYEDQTIFAVYSNKEKADQLRQSLQDGQKYHYQEVEEFELDPVNVSIT